MKLTIITCTYNSRDSVGECAASVAQQTYQNLEHLIQDGFSKDDTIRFVRNLGFKNIAVFESQDSGIYDALNKGIENATGEIIGILHSDDLFYDRHVTEQIMQEFKDPSVNLVYGDLVFVDRESARKIKRYWRSGQFRKWKLKFGWMPPHPTVFVRKDFITAAGLYNSNYRISGDYDAFLRWANHPRFSPRYIPISITKMRLGGISTKLGTQLLKIREDARALKESNMAITFTLLCKWATKIPQLFAKVK